MNTPEPERLPTVLEVLADIDRRARAAPKKIPHSPQVSSAESGPGNSAPSSWMRTEIYTSHQIKYARFRWGKGSESWGYVHISGGSCTDVLVQDRRAQVDRLIKAGGDLAAILALLRSWENVRAGRKPKA